MKKLKAIIEKNWDKLAHFCACALIFGALNILFGAVIAAFVTLIIGVIKEIRDDRFDVLDLAADLLGILSVVVYTFLILHYGKG